MDFATWFTNSKLGHPDYFFGKFMVNVTVTDFKSDMGEKIEEIKKSILTEAGKAVNNSEIKMDTKLYLKNWKIALKTKSYGTFFSIAVNKLLPFIVSSAIIIFLQEQLVSSLPNLMQLIETLELPRINIELVKNSYFVQHITDGSIYTDLMAFVFWSFCALMFVNIVGGILYTEERNRSISSILIDLIDSIIDEDSQK